MTVGIRDAFRKANQTVAAAAAGFDVEQGRADADAARQRAKAATKRAAKTSTPKTTPKG